MYLTNMPVSIMPLTGSTASIQSGHASPNPFVSHLERWLIDSLSIHAHVPAARPVIKARMKISGMGLMRDLTHPVNRDDDLACIVGRADKAEADIPPDICSNA